MRVLVALETCTAPKYAERRQMAIDYWGSKLQLPFVFEVFDGPRLGVGDSYEDLAEKTRAICQYARDNKFDKLLIVDDDVFVRVNVLKIPEGDYCGLPMPQPLNLPPGEKPFYCTGAFYWMSRLAFSIVADAPLTETWAEDRHVGNVLRDHGIEPKSDPQLTIYPCPCPHCDKTLPPFVAIAFSHRWLPEKYHEIAREFPL